MLCALIFIHDDDLQFKVDSERQIFKKLFMTVFIYSQNFCQKYVERKSPKIQSIVFRFDVWPGAQSLALRLITPTHYLLDYSDLNLDSLFLKTLLFPNNVNLHISLYFSKRKMSRKIIFDTTKVCIAT